MSDEFTPSAGVAAEAAPSEVSPATDVSALSDDEAYESGFSQQAEGDEPEQAPVEAKATEEKPQEEQEEIPELDAEPDSLKNVFKKHPELRRTYFAEKAYRELFPNISDAREVRTLFPTVEDARQAVNEASAIRYMDNLFNSDPARLAAEMHQSNPQAFRNMTSAMHESFHGMDPDGYRESVGRPVVSSVLHNLMQEAAELGGEEGQDLQTAIEIIAARLNLTGSQPAARQVPENDPRLDKLARLEAQESANAQRQWQGFGQAIDQKFWSDLNTEISSALEKANKAGVLPGVLAMVQKEAAAKIWADVQQNRWVVERMPGLMRDKWGRVDELASFKMSHARPKIVAEIQRAMKAVTAPTIEKAKQQVNAAQKVTSRKDVGAGGATSPKAGKADYSKWSDEDIYAGKHLVG